MHPHLRIVVASMLVLLAMPASANSSPRATTNPWQVSATFSSGRYGDGAINAISAASPGRAWAVGGNFETGGLVFAYHKGHWSRQQLGKNPWWDLSDVAAVSDDEAWAVGGAFGTGDFGAIFHYTDGQWRFVRQTNGSAVSVAVATPDDVAVVTCNWEDGGPFTLYQYNGEHWTTPRIPHPIDPALQPDECASAVTAIPGRDEFLMTGKFCCFFHHPEGFEEFYDGTRWTLARAKRVKNLYDTTATGSGDVFGVGLNPSANRWVALDRSPDGAWSTLPLPPGHVTAVAAASPADLWAVGGVFAARLYHYDGASWTKVPDPGPSDSQVPDVAVIPGTDPAAYWAVGEGDHLSILYKPPQ